jgi:hypothetical protein
VRSPLPLSALTGDGEMMIDEIESWAFFLFVFDQMIRRCLLA